MAGRKPLPTKLKVLRGNPGKRPLNKREPEPKVLTAIPRPPAYLDRQGAATWRRLARESMEMGILTTIDREALAACCMLFATAVKAEREMKGQPLVCVHTGENGSYEYPNPLIAIRNKALAGYRAFMAGFGMDPSSRSRIKVPAKQAEDPFESFLASGGLKSVPPAKGK